MAPRTRTSPSLLTCSLHNTESAVFGLPREFKLCPGRMRPRASRGTPEAAAFRCPSILAALRSSVVIAMAFLMRSFIVLLSCPARKTAAVHATGALGRPRRAGSGKRLGAVFGAVYEPVGAGAPSVTVSMVQP